MSTLKKQIRSDMTEAMKAGEKLRLSALRMLIAAIQEEETSGSRHELSDDEVLTVVAREVKKRKEAADTFVEAGRTELAENETAEAEVLAGYLPTQLSDDEVAALVADAVAQVKETAGDVTMKQMGQVMGIAKTKAGQSVDGKRLSTAVRAALS